VPHPGPISGSRSRFSAFRSCGQKTASIPSSMCDWCTTQDTSGSGLFPEGENFPPGKRIPPYPRSAMALLMALVMAIASRSSGVT
jgi:hypothetical protein